MGYSIGEDTSRGRFIGYGVPAVCEPRIVMRKLIEGYLVHATDGIQIDADYSFVRSIFTIQKSMNIQYARGAEIKRILLIRKMIH